MIEPEVNSGGSIKTINLEKVLERIHLHQNFPAFHPLTCGNVSQHEILVPHIRLNENGERELVLICPTCGYLQAQRHIPDFFFEDSFDDSFRLQKAMHTISRFFIKSPEYPDVKMEEMERPYHQILQQLSIQYQYPDDMAQLIVELYYPVIHELLLSKTIDEIVDLLEKTIEAEISPTDWNPYLP
jgi:hypothetical protein